MLLFFWVAFSLPNIAYSGGKQHAPPVAIPLDQIPKQRFPALQSAEQCSVLSSCIRGHIGCYLDNKALRSRWSWGIATDGKRIYFPDFSQRPTGGFLLTGTQPASPVPEEFKELSPADLAAFGKDESTPRDDLEFTEEDEGPLDSKTIMDTLRTSGHAVNYRISTDPRYKVALKSAQNAKRMQVTFPDAGILDMWLVKGSTENIYDVLVRQDFFTLLDKLLGWGQSIEYLVEESLTPVTYQPATKPTSKTLELASKLSGSVQKKVRRRQQPQTTTTKPVPEGDYVLMTDLPQRGSHTVTNVTDHYRALDSWLKKTYPNSGPHSLISDSEGLSLVNRVEQITKKTGKSKSKYQSAAAAAHSLYRLRVHWADMLQNQRFTEAESMKIDLMHSQILRQYLGIEDRLATPLWNKDWTIPESPAAIKNTQHLAECEHYIEATRQWNTHSSLVMNITSQIDNVYVVIKDLPRFSALVVLPGRVLVFTSKSRDGLTPAPRENWQQLWALLNTYFQGVQGKIQVQASLVSDLKRPNGFMSGFNLGSGYKTLASLVDTPIPLVTPKRTLGKDELRRAQELLLMIKKKSAETAEFLSICEQTYQLKIDDPQDPEYQQQRQVAAEKFDEFEEQRTNIKRFEYLVEKLELLTQQKKQERITSSLLTIPADEKHWQDILALSKQIKAEPAVNPYKQEAEQPAYIEASPDELYQAIMQQLQSETEGLSGTTVSLSATPELQAKTPEPRAKTPELQAKTPKPPPRRKKKQMLQENQNNSLASLTTQVSELSIEEERPSSLEGAPVPVSLSPPPSPTPQPSSIEETVTPGVQVTTSLPPRFEGLANSETATPVDPTPDKGPQSLPVMLTSEPVPKSISKPAPEPGVAMEIMPETTAAGATPPLPQQTPEPVRPTRKKRSRAVNTKTFASIPGQAKAEAITVSESHAPAVSPTDVTAPPPPPACAPPPPPPPQVLVPLSPLEQCEKKYQVWKRAPNSANAIFELQQAFSLAWKKETQQQLFENYYGFLLYRLNGLSANTSKGAAANNGNTSKLLQQLTKVMRSQESLSYENITGLGAFYQKLPASAQKTKMLDTIIKLMERGGVTKQQLESFLRDVATESHYSGALLTDVETHLQTLWQSADLHSGFKIPPDEWVTLVQQNNPARVASLEPYYQAIRALTLPAEECSEDRCAAPAPEQPPQKQLTYLLSAHRPASSLILAIMPERLVFPRSSPHQAEAAAKDEPENKTKKEVKEDSEQDMQRALISSVTDAAESMTLKRAAKAALEKTAEALMARENITADNTAISLLKQSMDLFFQKGVTDQQFLKIEGDWFQYLKAMLQSCVTSADQAGNPASAIYLADLTTDIHSSILESLSLTAEKRYQEQIHFLEFLSNLSDATKSSPAVAAIIQAQTLLVPEEFRQTVITTIADKNWETLNNTLPSTSTTAVKLRSTRARKVKEDAGPSCPAEIKPHEFEERKRTLRKVGSPKPAAAKQAQTSLQQTPQETLHNQIFLEQQQLSIAFSKEDHNTLLTWVKSEHPTNSAVITKVQGISQHMVRTAQFKIVLERGAMRRLPQKEKQQIIDDALKDDVKVADFQKYLLEAIALKMLALAPSVATQQTPLSPQEAPKIIPQYQKPEPIPDKMSNNSSESHDMSSDSDDMDNSDYESAPEDVD